MANPETLSSGSNLTEQEVLTLSELAAYLRVSDDEILKLISRNDLPAQKIGEEWRFLKRAVDAWLFYGSSFYQYKWKVPELMYTNLSWEKLLQAIEKRIPGRTVATEASPTHCGSKQAILSHFGVFQDDDDIEERLERIRAYRETVG